MKPLQKLILASIISFSVITVQAQTAPTSKDLTVARDGSGDYRNIQDAINAVRDLGPRQVTIHIRNGVYHEKLVIPSWKSRISLVGESMDSTIITNADYSGKPVAGGKDAYGRTQLSTFTSYTVLVQGDDFHAENLTVINAAGRVGQAVALHVEGDRCTIIHCKLLGNQDTLYLAKGNSRQYYADCTIEGTTDFIFGEATAVFSRCTIRSLIDSYITAAATTPQQKFGFVFLNCTLISDSGVRKAYLGRPWRPFAKTVFINTNMGAHILPEGWNPWKGDSMFPDKERTTYYAEYNSNGPGANPSARVAWSHQLTAKEAKAYTVSNILGGTDHWDPFSCLAPHTASAQNEKTPDSLLPGRGLSQHDFLYTGEWDYRKPVQTIYLVRKGKVIWTYEVPFKDPDGDMEELGDASMRPNGNIVFCRRTGASEVTPDKKLVWNYQAAKGTEIHSVEPIGDDRTLMVINGVPATVKLINIKTGKTEKECILPTAKPGPHLQFRRVRMTDAGTLLAAHLDSNVVTEYDFTGKSIWSVKIDRPWSASRLKNGNTLVTSNYPDYHVYEFDKSGTVVWDFSQKDIPSVKLYQLQVAVRLENGNTIITNWCPNGIKNPADWPSSVQLLEITPEKKLVWALRQWANPDLGPASSIQLLDEPSIKRSKGYLKKYTSNRL